MSSKITLRILGNNGYRELSAMSVEDIAKALLQEKFSCNNKEIALSSDEAIRVAHIIYGVGLTAFGLCVNITHIAWNAICGQLDSIFNYLVENKEFFCEKGLTIRRR